MENPEFSVNNLCDDLGMSRSQLYRKFESITGLTPNDFIRSVRLKRAAQLLRGSSYNISEISDRVGFNSIKYFNKYFKEEFGFSIMVLVTYLLVNPAKLAILLLGILLPSAFLMVVERLNKKSLHSHLYTENALKRV